LPAPARYAAVGYAAVMFEAIGGPDRAVETLARWSGRALDPAITGTFMQAADEILAHSDPQDLWATVVASEPGPHRFFRDHEHMDEVLAGFGDAADLKAPFFQGHSRGVAWVARAAAAVLPEVDPVVVHRAGLVHDLGRVAIPTGIWERPGPLRPEEWELVRLHPYHSGRMVSRSPVLEPLARIVSRHHERLDGSGYPMGIRAGELDVEARLTGRPTPVSPTPRQLSSVSTTPTSLPLSQQVRSRPGADRSDLAQRPTRPRSDAH
jgi:HD domain